MLYSKYEANQRAKKITKKVGVRSIYDIINDTTKSDGWKVNYIRHHYVYYDGNYSLFYDDSGQATSIKHELDTLVWGIVQKSIDPNELSKLNKKISQHHKEKVQADISKKQKELEEFIEKSNVFTEESKSSINDNTILNSTPEVLYDKPWLSSPGAQPYAELINMYLDSLAPEKKELYNATWTYTELKGAAKLWYKQNRKMVDDAKLQAKQNTDTSEENKNTFEALLRGYKRYTDTKRKNTPEE